MELLTLTVLYLQGSDAGQNFKIYAFSNAVTDPLKACNFVALPCTNTS